MKQNFRVMVGTIAGIGVLALAGCGSATEASATQDTIQALETQNYGTYPPVTSATTAPPVANGEGAAAGAETTSEETTHTVKANESLGIIAKNYGVDLQKLLDLNEFGSAAHVIHPGQEIKIPAGAKISSSDSEEEEEDSVGSAGSGSEGDGEKESDSSGCTYTIKQGDNPSKVAEKVGIEYNALVKANQSTGVLNNFLVGDELFIPPPGKCD